MPHARLDGIIVDVKFSFALHAEIISLSPFEWPLVLVVRWATLRLGLGYIWHSSNQMFSGSGDSIREFLEDIAKYKAKPFFGSIVYCFREYGIHEMHKA